MKKVYTGTVEAAIANAMKTRIRSKIVAVEETIPAAVTIQDKGTSVTQRSVINFTGSGVSVADSGGKTTVSVSGGGGGGNSYFPGGW